MKPAHSAPPGRPAFDRLGVAATVTCPECGERFKPAGLGVHRRHMHGHKATVKAPATCPDCGKRIAQGQNLARHRQMVHGGQKLASNGAAPVMRKGREEWICARCPQAFRTREARDRHQAMHPPIPPGPSVGHGPARTVSEAAQRVLRGGG